MVHELSDEIFGQRLRQTRQRTGMRQQDLADAMSAAGQKMHRSTIGKIESAERPATITEAFYLAQVIGVPVAYLVGELDEPFIDRRKKELAFKLVNQRLLIYQLQGDVAARKEACHEADFQYERAQETLAEAMERLSEIEIEIADFEKDDQ